MSAAEAGNGRGNGKPPVLVVDEIHTFYGSIEALKGISIEVNDGEIVTLIGASPIDGSSSSSTRGLVINARPMAIICCSPPDMVPAFWFSRSASRGKRSKTRVRSSSRRALSRERR